MLRLQRKLLYCLAITAHFPCLNKLSASDYHINLAQSSREEYRYFGGHLEIYTPLTNIFIITALYVIYSAANLDSLLSALNWCGMRGSNSRPDARKAPALPLS